MLRQVRTKDALMFVVQLRLLKQIHWSSLVSTKKPKGRDFIEGIGFVAFLIGSRHQIFNFGVFWPCLDLITLIGFLSFFLSSHSIPVFPHSWSKMWNLWDDFSSGNPTSLFYIYQFICNDMKRARFLLGLNLVLSTFLFELTLWLIGLNTLLTLTAKY